MLNHLRQQDKEGLSSKMMTLLKLMLQVVTWGKTHHTYKHRQMDSFWPCAIRRYSRLMRAISLVRQWVRMRSSRADKQTSWLICSLKKKNRQYRTTRQADDSPEASSSAAKRIRAGVPNLALTLSLARSQCNASRILITCSSKPQLRSLRFLKRLSKDIHQ